jgi:hypothetical protein
LAPARQAQRSITLRVPYQFGTIAALRQRRLICHLPFVVERESTVMDCFIDEIVRRSIRHARRMLGEGVHDWPTARQALMRILADLEARSPDHPSLPRLRAFIASRDRAWSRELDSLMSSSWTTRSPERPCRLPRIA